jgi:hypothetical protein
LIAPLGTQQTCSGESGRKNFRIETQCNTRVLSH